MTVTFLPIIGCRQHGEVYFQINITRSPLNRLEYKSSTKWAFAKWKWSASASSLCAQASLTRFHQCWRTPSLLPVWEAGRLPKPAWNIQKPAGCSPSSAVSGGLLLPGLFVRALISCSFSRSLDTWEFELSSFCSKQRSERFKVEVTPNWRLGCIPRTHFAWRVWPLPGSF